MYKLTRHGKTIMLAPLKACHDKLVEELGANFPAYQVRGAGYSIDPARSGAMRTALNAISN